MYLLTPLCFSDARNHIYAQGGFNGITRMNTGERYNPETNSWQSIPDMYSPRSNFAIEVSYVPSFLSIVFLTS